MENSINQSFKDASTNPVGARHSRQLRVIALSIILLAAFSAQSCKEKLQLTQELAMANVSNTPDSLLGAPKTQVFQQKISRQVESHGRLQLRTLQNDMQPTGFYIDSSSIITVHVRRISGTDLPRLFIGTSDNGRRDYLTWYQLKEGTNVINTDTDLLSASYNQPAKEKWGGNASIVFNSDSPSSLGEAEITFESGLKKMPYYVQGVTSLADYQTMLDVFADDVNSAMLVSDRTILTFTIENALQYRNSNVDSLLLICDQVIKAEEGISGLDNSSPEHQPRTNRILMTDFPAGNPFSGTYAIGFPQNSMEEILTPSLLKNSWGLFHELGHTHQQIWTWGAVGEVTVNIYSLAAERAMGVTPRLFVRDNIWPSVTAYLAKPEADRKFNDNSSIGFFGRLGMFHQLWLAYGDSFYQNLHKKCRVDKPILNNDDEKMAYFMTTACDIAGEDLTDFFRKWGLPASQATYAAIANKNLPQPSRDYSTLRD
ncbi:M60 family metallopeptidase [Sphingobacterium paludis]|nr:M60 family metallopeptidase [Sphingobacterium paludis]